MDSDTLGQMCWRLGEDNEHLFMKCKAVKPVWILLDLEQLWCTLMSLEIGAEVVKYVLGLEESK